jgi:hypothetical protein
MTPTNKKYARGIKAISKFTNIKATPRIINNKDSLLSAATEPKVFVVTRYAPLLMQ